MNNSSIMIGWATRSLVPPRPAFLRGMPSARLGKEVLDPITVTALAISSENGDQVVFASADLCGLDEPTIKRARNSLSANVADLEPESLIVNATHTHTSLSGISGIYPMPPEDCMLPEQTVEFMGDVIASAAAAAWNNRTPGGIAWGYGQAVVGHNRRVTHLNGETIMYGNTDTPEFSHIEGYEDHGVDLLFTFDRKKHLTGIVVNLACPSQCSQDLSMISADFWHETRQALRKLYGDDLFVLPQCSAAGDQSPKPLLHMRAEARMLALREGVSMENLDFGMALRREIARRLTLAIDEVFQLVAMDVRYGVSLVHNVADWELPMLRLTDADRIEAESQLARAEKELRTLDPVEDWKRYSMPYRQAFRYRRLIERHEAQKTKATLSTEAHAVRLGDIAFVTNPFELFLDFGERIKARAPALQTLVVQLAGNGSYVPTERAVAGMGYGAEPVSNPVGPEGGRMIVEETLSMLNRLF